MAGDAHGPLRVAPEEVRGAVQGVDQPAQAGGALLGLAGLLAEDGVARPLGADDGEDDVLCLVIGHAGQVGGRALGDDALGGSLEARHQAVAGQAGGPQGDVQGLGCV